MQYCAYGTPEFNKIYESAALFWKALFGKKEDFKDVVERNVRKICDQVAQTKLGVTRWSCEGHPDLVLPDRSNYSEAEGYIFIIAKDRESSSKLIEILHHVHADICEEWGWNFAPEIEAGCATISDDATYPVIIMRSPACATKTMRNAWWRRATESFKHHSKEYKGNV